jgi:hypothetical protein
MRSLVRRLLASIRRTKVERDLDAEVRFHLQSLQDEFVARGLDAKAARHAARRAFGGVEQMKEVYRDRRGLPLVDGALRDLRHTARLLLRSPGFTLTVVATIALAIGANAAVFLLLDQVVLRQLPVAQPSDLVIVSAPPLPGETGRGLLMGKNSSSDGHMTLGVSYPLYQTLQKRIPLFQDVLAHHAIRPTLLAGTTPMLADAELVTGNYFDMLGIKAALGRTLRPDDDRAPVGSAVAVLAHGFWQRQFGGDPSVLDRTIRVNNYPLTIVGVAAPGFSGTGGGRGPDLFVPLTMSNQIAPIRGFDRLSESVADLEAIARLAPGVSREQAEKYLRGVYETLFDQALGRITKTFDVARYKASFPVSLFPGGYAASAHSAVTRELKRTLQLLMAMVALVLLIAAGNVTNLLVTIGSISPGAELDITGLTGPPGDAVTRGRRDTARISPLRADHGARRWIVKRAMRVTSRGGAPRGTPRARRRAVGHELRSTRSVPGGIRGGIVVSSHLGACARDERRRARRARRRDLRRHAQMPQDPANHGRLLDQRDHTQAPATLRTRQHVESERALHQRRPALAADLAPRRLCRVRLSRRIGHRRFCRPTVRNRVAPHHL